MDHAEKFLKELNDIKEDRDYIEHLEKLYINERIKTQALEFKNSELMQEIERLKDLLK